MRRYARVEASRDGISFRSRRNQFVYQICLLIDRASIHLGRFQYGTSIGLAAAIPPLRQATFTAWAIGRRAAREGAIIGSNHRENVLVTSITTAPLASGRRLRRLRIGFAAGAAWLLVAGNSADGAGRSMALPYGWYGDCHHSNLYSNAPMPSMQRITWSGVALHEGVLPGYPVSHGCIRMSHDFAQKLWRVTKLGVRVIVARHDLAPVDFAHPNLFKPKPKPRSPRSRSASPMDASTRRRWWRRQESPRPCRRSSRRARRRRRMGTRPRRVAPNSPSLR